MDDYTDFLSSKRLIVRGTGRPVDGSDINPALFDHQRALTRWAARKGRAAVFADTGLGKTFIQVEWARLMSRCALIVAPLGVARQTVRIARERLGVDVRYVRDGASLSGDGLYITNYEMVSHFDPARFDAVVLDESSILKAIDGKTRARLSEMFADTAYKLCCTATPAPNDIAEIGNHAEFLGVMNRVDMLATFFIHDDEGWRLKKHARQDFYRWLASWAMSVRRPSDIGYSDQGYELPPLNIEPVWIESNIHTPGALFFLGLNGIGDRITARRQTLDSRVEAVAKMVNATPEQVIVWHGLNEEGQRLCALIPDAVLVEGGQTPEVKAAAIEDFQDGRHRVLVTKPKIGGFGLNLQNATEQYFCGLSDSFEMYYQCVRRSWRFGQTRPVNVRIVLATTEAEIWENVQRKEREAAQMSQGLIAHVAEFEREELADAQTGDDYRPSQAMRLPAWLVAA